MRQALSKEESLEPPVANEVLTPGGVDWEEVSNTLDPAGFLDSLDAQLGGLEPCREERLNARRFFAELDRQTNSFLLGGLVARGQMHRDDADQRRLAVRSIGNELRTRIQMRCLGLDESRGIFPSLEDRLFEHLKSKSRTISWLFLDLIDRYFGVSIHPFEQAFTWFANGDLRLVLPSSVVTTQPSSGNFFLFGEFALMAHDYGIEPERWWKLANVMVRSQRVFACVYAPADPANATLSSYAGRDYLRHGHALSSSELLTLQRRFQHANLPLEAARNAAGSLPGLVK